MSAERDKVTFRVIAIGDSSVGKTSIINKFLRDSFDPNESNTIGAFYDSFTEERGNQIIEIQLWDTAGQEQYRSLGPVYYRGASGAIIVFDLTNQDSFKSLNNWVKTFRSVSGENSVIVVAGNKSDLVESRAVLASEAKQWAQENSASYIETSAKTGEGIRVLFNELITTLEHLNADTFQNGVKKILKQNDDGEKKCAC